MDGDRRSASGIRNWMRMLLAVLLGNLIYFVAEPFLPRAFVHELYKFDPGLFLDFALCVVIYLALMKVR